MARDKVRIRFAKTGELRLISHHDLMRCFERMLRRADIPFHSTQGFNPRPRLVFALSLALGIVGRQEVLELELRELMAADEIHQRLTQQAPPGLEILSVRALTGKASAQVTGVTYRLALPDPPPPGLEERVRQLLAESTSWVERTRPQPRRLNVRPYLRDLRLLPGVLEMDLWVTPQGMARPEEILGLLGVRDLLDAGAVLERTLLELQDESELSLPPGGPVSATPAAGR